MSSKKGRRCINWKKDKVVQIAKMLVTAIRLHYGLRGEQLMTQFKILLPKVTQIIIQKSYTYADLILHIQQTQKRNLDKHNVLIQRADKTLRYREYNGMWSAVLAAVTVNQETGERQFSHEQWMEILRRWGNRCKYCGVEFSSVIKGQADHYIPYSKGGLTEAWNGVPACVNCNLRKGDMMPDDFIRILMVQNYKLGREHGNKATTIRDGE